MKHKHAEYIIAFANGEKVDCRVNHEPWYPVETLDAFTAYALEFRLAPKTMRIGSRDVPVPHFTGGGFSIDGLRGVEHLLFESPEDRAEFWNALVQAVKEAGK